MSLEDYLDFLGPDVIRLKGHRIGLEHIVERYQEGYSPELIAKYYGDLSLEQVYAVLAYYLHNQADVDAYIRRLDEYAAEQQRLSDATPSPVALRLRTIKAERERSAS